MNDLKDLIRGVNCLLDDDGVFVIECNYWGGMVKNKNYALIYHDHFSYFTVLNWMNFVPKFGLKVFDAIVTPAQGGSLRVFISRNREMTPRLIDLYDEEVRSNLNSHVVSKQYRKNVKEEAKKLYDLIDGLKADGNSIVGYGAAAKGFSVLKLAGIDQRHIDYFIDDSPAKQGKFTPVTHIPVRARDSIAELPNYFFITAQKNNQY